MRTLSSTLTTAQKSSSISGVLVKIVLTQGVNSYTYTQTRIKSLSHSEEPFGQSAEVILDNSDQTFTSLNLKGYKGVISYGITTAAGDEYSACAPLYVIAQQLVSWPGGLQCVLSLAGIPNLLDGDKANDEYTPTDEDIKTVKDLVTELCKAVLPARANSTAYVLDALVIASPTNGYTYKCTTAGTSAASAPTWPTTLAATVTDGTVVWTNQGKELTQFSHATAYTPTFDSEDALIDVFMPKDSFALNLNGSRLDAMRKVLEYTNCMMRVEDDGEVHIFVPTTTGTVYDYTYSLVSGEHMFFDKTLRQRLVIPNYIVVKSYPAHSTQYSGFAEDTDSSALIPQNQYVYARLASSAQATSVATALLDRHKLEAETGAAKVIMNVGAEVYDYVKVTDSRENDNRVGNIGSLTRTFRPRTWTLEFHFGSVRGAGQLGTIIPSTRAVQELTKGEWDKGEAGVAKADEISFSDKILEFIGLLGRNIDALWDYNRAQNNLLGDFILEGPQQTKSFLFHEITEPSTPDSDTARLYVDRTTGKLYKKNSDAKIIDLEDCGVMAKLSTGPLGTALTIESPVLSTGPLGTALTIESPGFSYTIT